MGETEQLAKVRILWGTMSPPFFMTSAMIGTKPISYLGRTAFLEVGLTGDGYLDFGLVPKESPNDRLVSTFTPDGSGIPKGMVLVCTKDKEFASVLIKHGIISKEPVGSGKAETPIGDVMFNIFKLNPVAEEHIRAELTVSSLMRSIKGIMPPGDYDA